MFKIMMESLHHCIQQLCQVNNYFKLINFKKGNSKIVHKLLIRGANKHIKDKEGKTPSDLARENDYNNVEMLL